MFNRRKKIAMKMNCIHWIHTDALQTYNSVNCFNVVDALLIKAQERCKQTMKEKKNMRIGRIYLLEVKQFSTFDAISSGKHMNVLNWIDRLIYDWLRIVKWAQFGWIKCSRLHASIDRMDKQSMRFTRCAAAFKFRKWNNSLAQALPLFLLVNIVLASI